MKLTPLLTSKAGNDTEMRRDRDVVREIAVGTLRLPARSFRLPAPHTSRPNNTRYEKPPVYTLVRVVRATIDPLVEAEISLLTHRRGQQLSILTCIESTTLQLTTICRLEVGHRISVHIRKLEVLHRGRCCWGTHALGKIAGAAAPPSGPSRSHDSITRPNLHSRSSQWSRFNEYSHTPPSAPHVDAAAILSQVCA